MKKLKFISTLLVSIVLLSALTTYASNPFPISYQSETTPYTAYKISHPNDAVQNADGIISYENGINDRGENYSWSAVGYGDDMYIGVLYGAISQTLQIIAAQNNIDYSIFKAGIDTLFNGTLFMGDEENNPDKENKSLLLKINTKTGAVSIVAPPNGSSYRSAIEFKDKLYFAATGSQPYLLEVDPSTDETKIVYQSEIPTKPFIAVGIRGLTEVNGQLIASMISDNGTYVVSSKDPSAGQDSFKVIATQEDLLDYPAYHYNDSIFGGAIWDIVPFNNKLYMTVVTGKSGNKQSFAMFCGEENSETGNWDFRLLIGDENDGAKYPFGLGADRSGAANLFVYDNHLYIGGYNDPMIALPSALTMDFEEIYKDLSSPVCLWRMDESENIEMVAGEPNDLFATVLGNQGAGFGSSLNQYVWRMAEHDNKLYLGTFDIGSLAYPLMQFTNGDILNMTPEEIKSQINYIKILIELVKEKQENKTLDSKSIDTNSINTNEVITNNTINSINNLSTEEDTKILNSLENISIGIENIENILDEPAYSQATTYSIFSDILTLYNSLLEEYEKIKDTLPPEVVEILDKLFNEDTLNNITYFFGTCDYLSTGERGFDLLVSDDGLNFDTITTNGFGDPYNHGCRTFAITDSGLCLGTANPFYGTQVWKLVDNSREEIQNSIIKNLQVTFDKNEEVTENKKVVFDVEYNNNILKSLELDYTLLTENIDYTINNNQIILSDKLLNSLDVNNYSIVFKFSAGARSTATLNVINSTNLKPVDPDPSVPVNPEEPESTVKPNPTNKLPNTGAPISSATILLLGGFLLISGTLLIRKKLNSN